MLKASDDSQVVSKCAFYSNTMSSNTTVVQIIVLFFAKKMQKIQFKLDSHNAVKYLDVNWIWCLVLLLNWQEFAYCWLFNSKRPVYKDYAMVAPNLYLILFELIFACPSQVWMSQSTSRSIWQLKQEIDSELFFTKKVSSRGVAEAAAAELKRRIL